MWLNKILPTLLISGFLIGCGSTRTIEVDTTPVNLDIIHPEPPRQIVMRGVKWTVFNKERLEQLLRDPKTKERDFVFFALDPQGYENLSLNFREAKRYIEQQKTIIIYYRNVTNEIQRQLNNPDPAKRKEFFDKVS